MGGVGWYERMKGITPPEQREDELDDPQTHPFERAEQREDEPWWPFTIRRVWDRDDGVTCERSYQVVPLSRLQEAEARVDAWGEECERQAKRRKAAEQRVTELEALLGKALPFVPLPEPPDAPTGLHNRIRAALTPTQENE